MGFLIITTLDELIHFPIYQTFKNYISLFSFNCTSHKVATTPRSTILSWYTFTQIFNALQDPIHNNFYLILPGFLCESLDMITYSRNSKTYRRSLLLFLHWNSISKHSHSFFCYLKNIHKKLGHLINHLTTRTHTLS